MKKFEYMLIKQPKGQSISEIEYFLNEYGDQGWELCSTDYGCFIFKREIKEG